MVSDGTAEPVLLARHSLGLASSTELTCSVGDVFRVGPNELSFATVQAFKDIYTARNPVIPKSEFYDMLGSGFSEADIACERDHKTAVQKRALFSTALSVKALTEQEVVIQRSIDAFIEKLGKLGCTERGLDLTKWYMMLSFDIAGEMAFGESFGCIASGTRSPTHSSAFSNRNVTWASG